MDIARAIRTKGYDRILLSGASGAIGSYFARHLSRQTGAEVVCLLRKPSSLARMRKVIGTDCADRLRPVFADLTDAQSVAAATQSLGSCSRVLAIHCAADVSWTKSADLMAPINIEGSLNFRDLAVATSDANPDVVMLSTAYIIDGKAGRNSYEDTKQQAENLLSERAGQDYGLSIIRCSLVVGAAEDGWIGRFNGLYPMVRVVALAEVPCLIADRSYQIDTVPLDVVWNQVVASAEQLGERSPVLGAVAASGRDAIKVQDFIGMVARCTAQVRDGLGLAPNPEISVVNRRQYDFLMRASRSWQLQEQFDQMEQICDMLSGYVEHGATGRLIEPRLLGGEIPKPASYLPQVIDYWLAANRHRIAEDRPITWLGREA